MSIVSKLFGDIIPSLRTETPKMFDLPPMQDRPLIDLAIQESSKPVKETKVADLTKKLSAARSPDKIEALKAEIEMAVMENPDSLATIQNLSQKYANPKTAKEAELANFFNTILNPPEAQPQFSDVNTSTIPQPFEGM